MTSVLVVPCLPVERPQLREAWRCLIGQGWDKALLNDGNVADVLWKARALPVVVDILSAIDLYEVRFDSAFVDVVNAVPRGTPLSMVAWRRDDELAVEVLVVPSVAVGEGNVVDAVVVRVVFPFRLMRSGGEDEITAEDLKIPSKDDVVRVRRFSVGKS